MTALFRWPLRQVSLYITESVDSVCRDTTYTQYMPIQKNLPKSQKRYTYYEFITTYRSSLSVFMTNKTPRIVKNRRERTTHGTRKTGKLFFFLLLSFFFRRASSTLPQSLMMVIARNSSILHRAVHLPIAFSQLPSLHQAAAAAHSMTMASLVTPFSRLYACAIT